MALKLRVISDHHRQLGRASTRMFGVHGGSIGRAPDNDWVLPDPERYVSSHHANIQFRGGRWLLQDTSSNGIFVNDADEAVSSRGSYELKDGDRLRFGDYELVVSIDEHSDFSPDASGQMPAPLRAQRRATTSKRAVGQSYEEDRFGSDLGEDLNINELLGAADSRETSISGYSVEESLIEQPAVQPQARVPTLTVTTDVTPNSLLDEMLTESLPLGTGPGKAADDWHMTTRRLAKREPGAFDSAVMQIPVAPAPIQMRELERPRRSVPNADTVGDSAGAVDAFCRGAGIDPAAIPTDTHAALLTLAGQMLREVVLSLMEGLKARADQKDRFRISKTSIQPNNNNPLKFSASVEEAMRKLLDSHNTRYLGPVESLRDVFGDLKNHQAAVDAAIQAAINDLLTKLDPSELQERFDRGLKRSPLLGVVNKTKYWDLYSEFYPLLNQRDARGMPAVFTEEFTRVYSEKIAELENTRKR